MAVGGAVDEDVPGVFQRAAARLHLGETDELRAGLVAVALAQRCTRVLAIEAMTEGGFAADGDGAVVIPQAMLTEVTEAAAEQEAMESWIMGEVEKGVPLPGLYPPNDENKAKYAAWRKSQKS